jgi:hypothetical protein
MKVDLKMLVRSRFMQFWVCRKKTTMRKKEREGGANSSRDWNDCDDNSAAIPIFQQLLRESQMFDRNNLVMEPGSLYLNVKEFRLAMRQYVIDEEFELGIEATDKTRYRGYCHGGECLWSINARVEYK